eukprot:TRINITY_DN32533_c0_g1_i1.p1 TRINITY_DN32533_c0_g1~~TRINITY_DN32533_c0_g1_i1.p1  ORF type:complete len:450 (+),score=122.32 TRINITY_DN32533_c0_g1_i1:110-1351(+)
MLVGVLCGRMWTMPAAAVQPQVTPEPTRRPPTVAERIDAVRESEKLRLQAAAAKRERNKAVSEAHALRQELTACQQQPAQESAARPASEDPSLPYLGIGIPTVPREPHGGGRPLRYLQKTLKALAAQVEGGVWEGRVAVWVMNMRPGRHAVFDELRDGWGRDHPWISFVENTKPLPDRPEDPLPEVHPRRVQQRPTDHVRRQTLDVVRLLRHAAGKSRYYLFYEDDFELCENGLMALGYMIQKAGVYVGDWIGIRCSFGLAGIVMRNADGEHDDIPIFADYLRKHYARRPPDHLVVEWYAGETDESKRHVGDRRVMAFRHNILKHIGSQSTVRLSKHWSFPQCFAELIAPQVFPVEAWNPAECPADDIWPCDGPLAHPSRISWNINDSLRVQKGTVVYVNKRDSLDGRVRGRY